MTALFERNAAVGTVGAPVNAALSKGAKVKIVLLMLATFDCNVVILLEKVTTLEFSAVDTASTLELILVVAAFRLPLVSDRRLAILLISVLTAEFKLVVVA